MVRISLGTAILLGLKEGALKVKPTTAYIMVGEKCLNNCSFCTQAKDSSSNSDLLSRVTWPEFTIEEILNGFRGELDPGIERICIQCLNDPVHLSTVSSLVKQFHDVSNLPISISIGPMGTDRLLELQRNGADRVGIALDGASPLIFETIKGEMVGNPNSWDTTWRSLIDAVEIFGSGKVSTHVIIGMGETDRDVFDTLVKSKEEGVTVSLFSYTPMKGTAFKGIQPSISRYRCLQLMRSSIMISGNSGGFIFNDRGKLISMDMAKVLERKGSRDAFRTRGCPDCNRPYYNERPRGPMYNYPWPLDDDEFTMGIEEAMSYLDRSASWP